MTELGILCKLIIFLKLMKIFNVPYDTAGYNNVFIFDRT